MSFRGIQERKYHNKMVKATLNNLQFQQKNKKRNKPKKWSKGQLHKEIEREAVASQKMQVRYHQRLTTDLNGDQGIYNPAVYTISPSGVDNLLPNYPNLTQGQRKIYIDTISIYIFYNENDTEVNSLKHQFIRHFVVYKDDETDATENDVTSMFQSTAGSLNVMEESLSAVIPQSGHIYKNQDSGWIAYDATRANSLSTGIVATDIPNFQYPFMKFKKTLRLKKEYQIADNGTLIDWKIPTVALLYTGASSEAPDITCYYHMYYKVLA